MLEPMQVKSKLVRGAKVANVAHETLLGMGYAHVVLERFVVSHRFATLIARYRLIVVFQFDVILQVCLRLQDITTLGTGECLCRFRCFPRFRWPFASIFMNAFNVQVQVFHCLVTVWTLDRIALFFIACALLPFLV